MAELFHRLGQEIREDKRRAAAAALVVVCAGVSVGLVVHEHEGHESASEKSFAVRLAAARQDGFQVIAHGQGDAVRTLKLKKNEGSFGIDCTGDSLSFKLIYNGEPVGGLTPTCDSIPFRTFPLVDQRVHVDEIQIETESPNQTWAFVAGP